MSQLSEEPARWLIVGLGNPEKKYTANRHNVGFHVLDRLAVKTGVSITDRRFQGWFGKAAVGPHTLLLLKPSTFMNASGKAAAAKRQTFLQRSPPSQTSQWFTTI